MEIKMFRFALLLLACSMCMSIVTCEKILYMENIPPAVNRLDIQCWSAGHRGSCNELMFESGQLDCSRVECASRKWRDGDRHRSVNIGLAANGTHCGDNRVCVDGSCITLPRNVLMPQMIGGRVLGYYKCFRPLRGKPNYTRNT